MSIQDITSGLGGLLLLIFSIWQIAEKVCGNMEWFQNLKKKREEKEKKKQKELITETVNQILPPIISAIEEKDKAQDEKLNMLIRSSNDMLRKDLVKIYYKYLPYKKILQYDMEFFKVAYRDYHEQKGNSFIDGIYKEISTWLVVLEEKDLHS